jgi:hypothetical protein
MAEVATRQNFGKVVLVFTLASELAKMIQRHPTLQCRAHTY